MDGQTANNQIVVNLPPDFGGNGELVNELKSAISDLKLQMTDINSRLEPLFYTEADLAKEFGVSEISIQRLRRAGKVSFTRFAGKIVFTRKQIEESLENLQISCKAKKK